MGSVRADPTSLFSSREDLEDVVEFGLGGRQEGRDRDRISGRRSHTSDRDAADGGGFLIKAMRTRLSVPSCSKSPRELFNLFG